MAKLLGLGCKISKRDIETVYTKAELDKIERVLGKTNRDQNGFRTFL